MLVMYTTPSLVVCLMETVTQTSAMWNSHSMMIPDQVLSGLLGTLFQAEFSLYSSEVLT